MIAYDVLNRVKKAETYIGSSNTRDLDYSYDDFGNLTSKTSTLAGDTDVTGYVYGTGAAGPHAVTSASVDGVTRTLVYDVGGTLQNGEVLKYDISGTGDDKYLTYNVNNQPTKIVVGSSHGDATPIAAYSGQEGHPFRFKPGHDSGPCRAGVTRWLDYRR